MADELTLDDVLGTDILELMGVKDLPEEKRRDLYTKMLDTITNRVISKVGEQLTDHALAEWQVLAETGEQARMQRFLQDRNIDLAKLMLQEAILYKAELAELSKPLKQAAQSQPAPPPAQEGSNVVR